MFMKPQNMMPGKLEEEFSKPVESIMRCEDFKSNFARRLSNRYTSRSPISSARQDPALKLRLVDTNTGKVPENVPERIELGSQLSKNINMEQNGEAVKPPDKLPSTNSAIRKTEVTVLNMEVETLRWQLAQTEANRQMHIALLKQIVAFLNRVKEHIELQNNDSGFKKETTPSKLLPRSFNIADLPRSRSVVHVNRTLEYSLTTPKKISSRKISKSISNVNGFRDCNGVWSQSKLSLTPETETSQKISEEMSRLITLANTVLSTKLPDLSSTYSDLNSTKQDNKTTVIEITKDQKDLMADLENFQCFAEDTLEPKVNKNVIYPIKTSTDYLISSVDESSEKFNNSATSLFCVEENDYSEIKLLEKDVTMEVKERSDIVINATVKSPFNKKDDFTSPTFIEDESGFSSMSSFQEIGIPIISIIPPSPCKEIGFMEDIPDILEDTEKWKIDTMELNKQTVKVFWV